MNCALTGQNLEEENRQFRNQVLTSVELIRDENQMLADHIDKRFTEFFEKIREKPNKAQASDIPSIKTPKDLSVSICKCWLVMVAFTYPSGM